jgi:molybdopterin-guanine dinucleotide biosynthesis protein A
LHSSPKRISNYNHVWQGCLFDDQLAESDWNPSMLSLVIQAGGESRRMGTDKALLPFLGQPLILRPLNRLAGLADEVLITSNQPEIFGFLGLTPVPDRLPGCGALGGLYTALSAARYPYVAVVACDMPFTSPEIFAIELGMLQETGADAVIPRSEAGTEPFHAVYRRETCLPYIQSALEAGKRRVDAWFPKVNIRYLTLEEILPYDPDQLAFLNINTLEELYEAERIVRDKSIL